MYKLDIAISIPRYEKRVIDNKKVTFYVIQLEHEGNEWEVFKRYSEFERLNKHLADKIGNLPEFPGKGFLKKQDEAFLVNRKCKLEIYMIKLTAREDLFSIPEFLKFLKVKIKIKEILLIRFQIDLNAGELSKNELKNIGRIDHERLGFRDFLLFPKKGIFVCASSNMELVSR